jgi:hypothetical protein
MFVSGADLARQSKMARDFILGSDDEVKQTNIGLYSYLHRGG